jgi:hypothetical protein
MRASEQRKTAAATLRTPVDLGLAIRMLGWSLLLPGLKRVLPLPSLVRLVWSRPRGERQPDRERIIVFLAQRIYRLRPLLRRDNCLERSLLTYRFLSMAGADPRLVIGIGKAENDFAGHAWVLIDDAPLFDTHSTLNQYVAVTEFAGRGRRELN